MKILNHTADDLRKRLETITINGDGGLEAYANEDCERFMRTLHLIPQDATKVLEIGANPYFLSILARWFRPDLEFVHTNYFGDSTKKGKQEIKIDGLDGKREVHIFEYHSVNVEADKLPGHNYDCVLFCEVLEHMTNDPLHPMKEINRVTKKNGHVVLTTPNVARMENVARLIGGHNIYDPYSGFGPYGRHNREYTKHELALLFRRTGFEPEILDTHDVHTNRSNDYFPEFDKVAPILEFRFGDLGQYHFARAIKTGAPEKGRPTWLFRSYPASELDEQEFSES